MIEISKRTLAILLCACLIIGSVLTIIAAKGGIGGTRLITGEEYEYYDKLNANYSKLDSLKEYILSHYYVSVDEETLMNNAYHGLVSGLDDIYSKYIPAEEYQAYLQDLFGTEVYGGIGVTFLSAPIEKGYEVISVNTNGPAFAAGMRKYDVLISVNGVDVLSMDSDTLRDTMRGEPGTQVTVGVLKGSIEVEYVLTRASIPQQSIYYEKMDDIGYIQISTFIMDTHSDFKAALNALEKEGVKGLVIDLRDNGGGLVDSSIQIADELMNKGVVVSTLDHDGKKEIYSVKNGRTELPYVLLVNGNTASASEILTAGVQDNKEGTVIGTQTYGKGIIQNTVLLTDGSALKYTELQYLSPNGNPIHGNGITPDVYIDLDLSCYNEYGILERDVQLEKAIEVLRTQIK